MKICKDNIGYFILDNVNKGVVFSLNGNLLYYTPTIMHLGISHWHHNEYDNKYIGDCEILIDHISSFKALHYTIFTYLIEQSVELANKYTKKINNI